jgi:hypothetical protein
MQVDRPRRAGAEGGPEGVIGRRRARGAALALLLLAACESREPAPAGAPRGEDPRVRGSVLVANGFFLGGLSVVELPDGEPQPVPMPRARPVQAGWFMDDGSVVAVLDEGGGGVRVYRSGVGERPLAVGAVLDGVFTFSFAGGAVLAADCSSARPSAYVLEVAAGADWRRIEATCGAALAPDAGSVAWSPDGRTVVEADVAGGPARTTLDLDALDDVPASLRGDLEVGGELRWGEAGLAIPIGTSERQAVAIVRDGGEVHVAPLGHQGAGLAPSFAWQPGAHLLAVASWTNLEGALRIVDAAAAQERVVGLQGDPFATIVWSPDGDVLLAASDTWWRFVTPDGTWIRSIPVGRGNSLPLAWRSA